PSPTKARLAGVWSLLNLPEAGKPAAGWGGNGAALVGDTARATMLGALMGGQSLTATELAYCANVSRSTASGHLSKLVIPEAYQSKTVRHGPNCSRETIANLAARMRCNLEAKMKRTAIRVEPISTYLERRRKGPIYPVIVAGETVYVSGLPPFDPETGAK